MWAVGEDFYPKADVQALGEVVAHPCCAKEFALQELRIELDQFGGTVAQKLLNEALTVLASRVAALECARETPSRRPSFELALDLVESVVGPTPTEAARTPPRRAQACFRHTPQQ